MTLTKREDPKDGILFPFMALNKLVVLTEPGQARIIFSCCLVAAWLLLRQASPCLDRLICPKSKVPRMLSAFTAEYDSVDCQIFALVKHEHAMPPPSLA